MANAKNSELHSDNAVRLKKEPTKVPERPSNPVHNFLKSTKHLIEDLPGAKLVTELQDGPPEFLAPEVIVLDSARSPQSISEKPSETPITLAKPIETMTEGNETQAVLLEEDPLEIILSILTAEAVVADTTTEFLGAYDMEPVLANESLLPTAELVGGEDLLEEEIIFNDEVWETFEQLIALVEPENDTSERPPRTHEIFIHDEVISLQTEAATSPDMNTFQTLLSEETKPDHSFDIEVIIAGPNEQPLTETLVRLSFYLAETPEEPASSDLKDALGDVLEVLSSSKPDNAGDKVEKEGLDITPELTQKLLVLLRAVGYENPGEVLVDFTTQHGLELLLEAIEYLYQLLDDNNRQEFSPKMSVNQSVMKTDDPLGARLGRVILYYFRLNKLIPDL